MGIEDEEEFQQVSGPIPPAVPQPQNSPTKNTLANIRAPDFTRAPLYTVIG